MICGVTTMTSSLLVLLVSLFLKSSPPMTGILTQQRQARDRARVFLLNQSTNDERLIIVQRHGSLRIARGDFRHTVGIAREAVDGGVNGDKDVAVSGDDRRNAQMLRRY